MTMHDAIEVRLREALAVDLSEDGRRWLDRSVAEVMARPQALQRRGWSTRRMILRPLALVAALVIFTGTVVGGMGLLDRIFESSGTPGWKTAWERAEPLAISRTDAGVTITLERAYADLNQVLVGFTVTGLEVPASSLAEPAPLEWSVELRDPSGRTAEQWATSMYGKGVDETGMSAVAQAWEGAVSPVAGTWLLTFTSVGFEAGGFVPGQCDVATTDPECLDPAPGAMVRGTWRFEFELPTPTGIVVSADASDTVGPATLALTELRVTPTMIAARIHLTIDGIPVSAWAAESVAVRNGAASYDVGSSAAQYRSDSRQGTGDTVLITRAGADEVGGTWEIEIPEVQYQMGDEELVSLSGPWKLAVTVP